MAENHKKTILTAKQKLELIEKFENGESATELAEDYASKKRCYRADRHRTFANEDDNITGLWKKKMTALDAIFGMSWAWSSMNPATLVRS
jgi:hypothetical protein